MSLGSFKNTCLGLTLDSLNRNPLVHAPAKDLRKTHRRCSLRSCQEAGNSLCAQTHRPTWGSSLTLGGAILLWKLLSCDTESTKLGLRCLSKQAPGLPLKVSLFIYGMYVLLIKHKYLLRGGCDESGLIIPVWSFLWCRKLPCTEKTNRPLYSESWVPLSGMGKG